MYVQKFMGKLPETIEYDTVETFLTNPKRYSLETSKNVMIELYHEYRLVDLPVKAIIDGELGLSIFVQYSDGNWFEVKHIETIYPPYYAGKAYSDFQLKAIARFRKMQKLGYGKFSHHAIRMLRIAGLEYNNYYDSFNIRKVNNYLKK